MAMRPQLRHPSHRLMRLLHDTPPSRSRSRSVSGTCRQPKTIATETGYGTLRSVLGSFKAAKLKELALALGAPLSGTKSEITDEILECLNASTIDDGTGKAPLSAPDSKERRVLSIDMGIRNLAFAQLTTPSLKGGGDPLPKLDAWRRITATSDPLSKTEDAVTTENTLATTFTPAQLSIHAYGWASHLLHTYKPNVILIERQRFRSGGASAVLEWSLRVGVFEGMLHALFLALARERSLHLHVRSVDPGRIVRYWMGVDDMTSQLVPETTSKGTKAKAKPSPRDIKACKIHLVAKLLSSSPAFSSTSTSSPSSSGSQLLDLTTAKPTEHDPTDLVNSFLDRANPVPGRRSPKSPAGRDSKIDDLADALLSAFTWLQWQKAAHSLKTAGTPATRVRDLSRTSEPGSDSVVIPDDGVDEEHVREAIDSILDGSLKMREALR